MTAALLCPGPSIANVTPHRLAEYDLTIGVNRAAIAFECSWWAATDYPVLRDWQHAVLGSPSLLTRRQTYLDFRRRLRLTDVRLLEDIACPVPRWDTKTATAALGLLSTMDGIGSVDVFGADWTDQPDFDGVQVAGCDRSAERWATERQTWDAMADLLAARGTRVTRH